MAQQPTLDFFQFHPIAAHLYLMVKASQKFNGSIREIAGEVAGFVESFWGGLVAGQHCLLCRSPFDKPFSRQFWPVQIAAGDTDAAHIQFAGDTNGDRLLLWIQKIDLYIGDGATDGRATIAGCVRCLGTSHDRRADCIF